MVSVSIGKYWETNQPTTGAWRLDDPTESHHPGRTQTSPQDNQWPHHHCQLSFCYPLICWLYHMSIIRSGQPWPGRLQALQSYDWGQGCRIRQVWLLPDNHGDCVTDRVRPILDLCIQIPVACFQLLFHDRDDHRCVQCQESQLKSENSSLKHNLDRFERNLIKYHRLLALQAVLEGRTSRPKHKRNVNGEGR